MHLTVKADPDAAALLVEPQAEDVVLWLSRFEETCERAMLLSEPSVCPRVCARAAPHNDRCVQTLVGYLLQLAHYTNAAHAALRVQGAPADVAAARLAMFNAARVVLGSGLRLLGLTPLERI